MKEKTLVILAAGMGSRFGGLKQAEKFGPHGEYIIDYSIYDAIKCGFNKVVFIIKEENYDLFRETVGARVEKHVNVEYVFQSFDNVPSEYNLPEDRVKPLGTAHAVICAKDKINGPYAVIGADDFYGRDAFKVLSEFMDTNPDEIGVVGYNIKNTLSDKGSVKRGTLVVDENNNFIKIIESVVEEKDGVIEAEALSNGEKRILDKNSTTSMIISCFPINFREFLDKKYIEFLNTADLSKAEFLLPDMISAAHDEKFCNVKVLNTTAKWVGVTYKEDKDTVVEYINELIKEGVYNEDLWN